MHAQSPVVEIDRSAAEPAQASRRPHLSPVEFQNLGLYRVAYLIGARDSDGALTIAIHGADGVAVALVEDIATALRVSSELGLAVVAVH
jgi:hypothetical protein